PHGLEFLRSDHAHVRLGFRADSIAGWLEQSGLEVAPVRTIAPPVDGAETPDGERLTVSLWLGRDRRNAEISTVTTVVHQDASR
ncbi:MAG TPA: hypothetical protein VNB52_11775, partial [Ilumatobacteraceae bacterium]|nr:hypothetical protein [Ilumatobacteraceae bacterium]